MDHTLAIHSLYDTILTQYIIKYFLDYKIIYVSLDLVSQLSQILLNFYKILTFLKSNLHYSIYRKICFYIVLDIDTDSFISKIGQTKLILALTNSKTTLFWDRESIKIEPRSSTSYF